MSKYTNKEIEQILKDRYKESFTVQDNQYVFETGLYQYTAYCSRIPQIKIYGEYKKNGDAIEDNYPQMLHIYQAEVIAKDFLSAYYESFALKVSASSNYAAEGSDITPFKELLKKENVEVDLLLNLYIFRSIGDHNANRILKGIAEFANHLKQSSNNTFHFRIYFWDESHFEDKEINNISFGFNVHNENYYDSMSIKKKFIRQGLAFDFNSESPNTIAVEHLQKGIYIYEGILSWQDNLIKF